MTTPSLALYRALTNVGKPLIAHHIRRRLTAGKEDPRRVQERFGLTRATRPDGELIWIHGASIGEAVSVYPLIDWLCKNHTKTHVLLTTGTVPSAHLSENRLPKQALHQFAPIDRQAEVVRFLDHWQPNIALWVESELWPNMITHTAQRNVPMILLNARMSLQSYHRWRFAPGLARALLNCFSLCLAQSGADGERFTSLGAQTVHYPGNLKYAAPPLPVDGKENVRFGEAVKTRMHWLAASTHEGEECIAGAVHRILQKEFPRLLTFIVPRHPIRGDSIATFLRSKGFRVAQRSRDEPIGSHTDIYLADTIGELGLFYRVADIVFIGGSLAPHGGHNPLEPARLQCALLSGPHTENFLPVMRSLQNAGALDEVGDANTLSFALRRLFNDETLRLRRANAAMEVATAASDVLGRVIAEITPFLPAPPKFSGLGG